MFATCETVGCRNAWAPIRVSGEWIVLCGVCGNQITNITDIEVDEGQVLPEWTLEMLQQQNSNN